MVSAAAASMEDTAPVTVESQLIAIRAENKAILKLLRKIKSKQDDPDGVKASERASKNGFSKPLAVTDTLRDFLGLAPDEKISRSEVTKRVNAYAKEKNLKQPDNGRVFLLDDKLKVRLNPPEGTEITFRNIQKFLSPHYIKEEPVAKKAKTEAAPAEVAAPPAAAASSSDATAAPAKRPVVKRKAPAP
jgi:chromatin remodeling complex protein RSC6